jgi:hypothetical protein
MRVTARKQVRNEGVRRFKSAPLRQGVYAVSGSPGPIRIVPNGLISRLEPASSWGDLLAQAEDLQNLARNRRDLHFGLQAGPASAKSMLLKLSSMEGRCLR